MKTSPIKCRLRFCLAYRTAHLYSGFFLLSTLSFLTILNVDAQQQIEVEEDKIEITQAQDSLDQIGKTTLIVTVQGGNLANVKAVTMDLRGGQSDWIEKSKVKVEPHQFNLIRGEPVELVVTFVGLNEGPGKYSGNLLLTSPNFATVKIPITVSIHANPSIALFLVGLGVIISFIFKFLLLKVEEKAESKTILEMGVKMRDQTMQLKQGAPNTLGYSVSNSKISVDTLNSAIDDYNKGYFRESIGKAQDSINLLGSILQDPRQPAAPGGILKSISLKRGWLLTRPVRGDYATYAGVTLALLLSVLLVWQLYYPQLSAFGIFPIDYIAAFLFGYGSQAILINEILSFAKRIWPV